MPDLWADKGEFMPFVKLVTGDIVEIAEPKFKGLMRTNRINPVIVHYDPETGKGFVGNYVVALYRDDPRPRVAFKIPQGLQAAAEMGLNGTAPITFAPATESVGIPAKVGRPAGRPKKDK
jgi:hypothetical protein